MADDAQPGSGPASPRGVAATVPSTPSGGGALKGLGEVFDADEQSGAASISIPLPTTAARGFEPSLTLSYSSTSGNGPYGLGWDITLPSIARDSSRRIPTYDDRDGFVFGSDKLVPLDGGTRREQIAGVTYDVTAYARQLETTFDSIERWQQTAAGETFWRVRDRDNATIELGRSAQSRIADPADPTRVFRWLVDSETDADGDRIEFEYRAEDLAGVPAAISEVGHVQTAQRYVSRIRYANAVPAPVPLDAGQWHVELVFDYGDYDTSPANPDPYTPVRPWAARTDPFSEFGAGFEIRTHRLCRGVLLFHRFESLAPAPVLAHLTRLAYRETPRCALLERVDSVGYRWDGDRPSAERYRTAALPPLELGYSGFDPLGASFEPVLDLGGRQLPGVSQPPLYSVADLEGEGVPGILYGDGRTVLYWSPELAPAAAGSPVAYAPPRLPVAFPAPDAADGATARLVDLSGDGRLDLLVLGATPGFYASRPDGTWEPFVAFAGTPTTFTDPDQTMVDVTGDGRPDLVQIAARRLRYFPSRGTSGYGPPQELAVDGLPQTGTDAVGRWVGFADVFGSGQQHLAVIRDGTVECWPNLGYGRFGPPVRLANAPRLGSVAPDRILLADADGSGTADIMVVYPDRVRVWVNESGNSFAAPFDLPLPVRVGGADQVQVADLAGTGTDALLVSASAPARHWSYDWSGGSKPYLLTSIRNSLGAETEIAYASSTRFQLEDKRAGRPWVTTLPFPVQVVSGVVQRDLISGAVTTRSFRYHHGYYDPVERAFRGFGMVERADAEVFELGFDAAAVPAADDPLHPPPTLTRTWYHTGAWVEERPLERAYRREWWQGDPDAYQMPGPAFDWGGFGAPSAAMLRQAHGALRGTALRHELYGLDGSAAATVPYQVGASRSLVRLIQPPRDGRLGVFHVSLREGIDYDYEREADDPRVTQGFTLAVDRYGDVRLSAELTYPRRAGRPDAIPEQVEPHLTVQRSSFIDVDEPSVRLLGLLAEVESFEIPDVAAAHWLGFDEVLAIVTAALPPAEGSTARRVHWERFFYAAEGGGEAPPGRITPQALLLRSERAAYDVAETAALFAPVLSAGELAGALERGGFRLDAANGVWWRPTPRGVYTDASSFFVPAGVVDPFGARTSFEYDSARLAMTGARMQADAILPHVTSVGAFDYQAMLPAQVVDLNGNTSEALFDPLGMVIAATHYGKQDGRPVGFAAVLGRDWPRPAETAEVIADPGRFLQDAASFFHYDLLSWAGTVEPAAFAGLVDDVGALWEALVAARLVTPEGVRLERARACTAPLGLPERFAAVEAEVARRLAAVGERMPAHTVQLVAPTYPSDGRPAPASEILIELQYFDGFGRVVQDKLRAEPGPAIAIDGAGTPATRDGVLLAEPVAERWVTSARVRYNDKGKPVSQYDPYFVDTWRYTAHAALDSIGHAYTLSYDALSRLVRVDTPKGFFRRHEYRAWSETQWDEDDTVVESEYYRTHIDDPDLDPWERQALQKAALLAGTPATEVVDNLARPVRTIARVEGLVTSESFTALGYSNAESAAIAGELSSGGFLDHRGALTIAYQPHTPGFSLHLSPPYDARQSEIIERLDAIAAAHPQLVTRRAFDISGNETWSVDPRLWAIWEADGKRAPAPRSAQAAYALDGDLVRSETADAGARYSLNAIDGGALLSIDARAQRFDVSYDAARRMTAVHASGGAAAVDRDVERKVYGDALSAGKPPVPDPAAVNLIGEVYEVDAPGVVTVTPSYTIVGDPLRQTYRFRDLANVAPSDTLPGVGAPLEAAAFERSSAYDALRRVVAATDPDGNVLEATWLVSGELGSLKLIAADRSEHAYVSSISYNARAERVALAYLDGKVTRSFDYDAATGRLTRLRSGAASTGKLQDLRYYEDAAGNPTHVTDGAFQELFGGYGPASPQSDYTTDALYRLVAATGRQHVGYDAQNERQGGYDGLLVALGGASTQLVEDTALAYACDDAGSVYWARQRGGSRSWTRSLAFSGRSNRAVGQPPAADDGGFAPAEDVRPAAEIDVSFDGNGNQTAIDGLEGTAWDERNLLAATHEPGDPSHGERYAYDARGARVRKVVSGPTGVLDVLYVGGFEIHRELATGAARHVLRVMDGPAQLAEHTLDVPAGTTSSRLTLSDRLGSSVLELDEDGKLLAYEEYLPYGGTAWAAAVAGGSEHREYRFAGAERDRTTGLYLSGQRYYVPWLARWLSPDPAGTADGLNLYQYAGSSPVRYADASGTAKVDVGLGTGNEVIVTPAELLAAVKAAGKLLAAMYSGSTLTKATSSTANNFKKRKYDSYEVVSRGDVLALAYSSTLRGSGAIAPLKAVKPYYLEHGTVSSFMSVLAREVGVHGTRTLKNQYYSTKGEYGMPGYPSMEVPATRDAEKKEGRRLQLILRGKQNPSGTSYNNRIIPVMAISETDRSEVGGLLALIELYNIEYGNHTMFNAFAAKEPYFIGAEVGGGAKALKSIDRGEKLKGRQQDKLDASLTAFVETLGRQRKFAGATTAGGVQTLLTALLVKRAGRGPAVTVGTTTAPSTPSQTILTTTLTTLSPPAQATATTGSAKKKIKLTK